MCVSLYTVSKGALSQKDFLLCKRTKQERTKVVFMKEACECVCACAPSVIIYNEVNINWLPVSLNRNLTLL